SDAFVLSTSPTGAFEITETAPHVGSTYVARSRADQRFAVEIDCDDWKRDTHQFGITPIIDGRRYEVPMWEGTYALITPDWNAGPIRCVRVATDDRQLIVQLEAGSYKTLDSAAADKPVPLEA